MQMEVSWLWREYKKVTCKCHKGTTKWHQSSSPKALTLMINTYHHICRICHKPAWIFTCTNRFLLVEMAWQDFFPHRGFIFFRKPGLVGFFPHGGFIFPQKPPWSSNRGGEWHRPRLLRAWNRWLGPGIEPWTHKKIMLQGQGIQPWTHKKDCVQGQGFEPWTDQNDRSYNHACNR